MLLIPHNEAPIPPFRSAPSRQALYPTFPYPVPTDANKCTDGKGNYKVRLGVGQLFFCSKQAMPKLSGCPFCTTPPCRPCAFPPAPFPADPAHQGAPAREPPENAQAERAAQE